MSDSPLDSKAETLWRLIKECDEKMKEVTAEREGLFQQYNECLAMLRDRDRSEQPKTTWDEALERWVDETLGPDAEVIPLRREEPDLGAS